MSTTAPYRRHAPDAPKAALRAEAKRQRQAAARAAGDGAGQRVRDRFLAAIPLPPDAVIAAYWPVGDEVDVRPLLHALHERGHACLLPVVTGPRPLIFREWRPGQALIAGAHGIPVPPPTAPERAPRVLCVPLLAFDRTGHRLGYGGGHYDRTLAGLRAAGPILAVGIAYADQEMASLPADGHDQRLDWVVTEADAIAVQGPAATADRS